jgi:octaprenyl-diphosphate synthase
LITSCCSVGASSSGADADTVNKLTLFGECVGMAFQIKDDLFDYGAFEIGKPTGIDIREKKMTLPLIYALNQTTTSEKNRIIGMIKKSADKPKYVSEVIAFVKAAGGLEYATGVMERYHRQATDILVTLPPSVYRDSLEHLVQYTIDRTK